MTQQPKWKPIGRVGDIDPIAYGGGFVYTDSKGVYAPEMDYFEPDSDQTWHRMQGNTPVCVYRILIERDSTREWWYSRLNEVAGSTGIALSEYQKYANGNTMERAQVYSDLIHYFGAEEFDSYPRTTTEARAYFRYWREMRHSLKGEFPKESA